MATKKYKFFILTGEPGVGKTTLIKKLSTDIASKGIKTTGFYTEEVRNNGTRRGFDVVSLDGIRGPLARDQNLLSGPVKHKVGKYGVLIEEFENVAIPSLLMADDTPAHLLVIDEIGKMEFFSASFKTAVKTIFSSSENTVLATVPVRSSDHLIESIKKNSLSKVWVVTRENRNSIHQEILKEINTTINFL